MRPILPLRCPESLRALIHDCWDDSYLQRPTFKTIVERLNRMIGDIGSLGASHLTWNSQRCQLTMIDSTCEDNKDPSLKEPRIRSALSPRKVRNHIFRAISSKCVPSRQVKVWTVVKERLLKLFL